ncbi:hypothetical protein [Vibrio harveyi]
MGGFGVGAAFYFLIVVPLFELRSALDSFCEVKHLEQSIEEKDIKKQS